MSKFDAIFSVSGLGTRRAYCVGIDWGSKIQGQGTESRIFSTFYPKRVTTSSFSVSIVHPTHSGWENFMDWMQSYARQASDPNNNIGPMAVSVPQRSFSRVGIPVNGFAYGDDASDVSRRSRIYFEGASDPLRPGDVGTSSEPGLVMDTVVERFYPTGLQEGGSTENSFYDLIGLGDIIDAIKAGRS